jgi:hypothetical protein
MENWQMICKIGRSMYQTWAEEELEKKKPKTNQLNSTSYKISKGVKFPWRTLLRIRVAPALFELPGWLVDLEFTSMENPFSLLVVNPEIGWQWLPRRF